MDDCIFCKIAQGQAKPWKVYEDEHTIAFFDYNPVNEYHTLVIPKKHHKDIFDLPEEELKAVASTIKKVTSLLKEKVNIENVQIVNSSGSEAQQDVFHVHFHVVPRHKEDGQDVKWNPKTELRAKFDQLLQALK